MMNIKIFAGKARGKVHAPPSKSMAHRMLICAMMSEGKSVIHRVPDCEDVLATIDCMHALGIRTERCGDIVTVYGADMRSAEPTAPLYCRESGSTLRFLLPVALLCGRNVLFYGERGLMQRPMEVYRDICNEKGLTYLPDAGSIAVRGPLRSGEYRVPGNISSQFISGLLFALAATGEESRIHITTAVESRSYIDLTIEALSIYGVSVLWEDEYTLLIAAGQKYTPCETEVEGDYSGAAFTEALGYLGGKVAIMGLNESSLQGDRVYRTFFPMLKKGVPTIHIGNCPDLGPVLFALAAANHGAVFTGTGRLRIKESDRGAAMASELRKFGVAVSVYEDKAVVYPADFHKPTEILLGHGDHRIVMALAVLCTLTGGEIAGAEAVKKSYPGFFDDMEKLGIEVVKNGTE